MGEREKAPLIQIILNGMRGEIQVKRKVVYNNVMPKLDMIPDEDIVTF